MHKFAKKNIVELSSLLCVAFIFTLPSSFSFSTLLDALNSDLLLDSNAFNLDSRISIFKRVSRANPSILSWRLCRCWCWSCRFFHFSCHFSAFFFASEDGGFSAIWLTRSANKRGKLGLPWRRGAAKMLLFFLVWKGHQQINVWGICQIKVHTDVWQREIISAVPLKRTLYC